MVPIPGIGPGTSPLPRECSATEPNGPYKLVKNKCVKTNSSHQSTLERGRRIELLALAWKAKVLPLYEPRASLLCKPSPQRPRTLKVRAPTANRRSITGGEGWIRTSVLVRGQIYSLLPLTTRPPLQPVTKNLSHEPRRHSVAQLSTAVFDDHKA